MGSYVRTSPFGVRRDERGHRIFLSSTSDCPFLRDVSLVPLVNVSGPYPFRTECASRSLLVPGFNTIRTYHSKSYPFSLTYHRVTLSFLYLLSVLSSSPPLTVLLVRTGETLYTGTTGTRDIARQEGLKQERD